MQKSSLLLKRNFPKKKLIFVVCRQTNPYNRTMSSLSLYYYICYSHGNDDRYHNINSIWLFLWSLSTIMAIIVGPKLFRGHTQSNLKKNFTFVVWLVRWVRIDKYCRRLWNVFELIIMAFVYDCCCCCCCWENNYLFNFIILIHMFIHRFVFFNNNNHNDYINLQFDYGNNNEGLDSAIDRSHHHCCYIVIIICSFCWLYNK